MARARVAKCFFGYSIARVDEYLRSLGVFLASRISASERDLDALIRTRDETERRLSEKMEEVADYRRKATSYAGLAVKGEAIATSVLEAARYECERIRAAADRYVEECEMSILTLDRNIADARSQVEDLLEQVRTVVDASAKRAGDTAAASKVVGHVLSAAEDNAPFTVTGSRGFLEVDMSTQSVKVLSQNGEAIGSLKRLVLDKAKERVCGYEIEPLGQGGPLALPAMVPSHDVVGLKRGAIIVRNSWLNDISATLNGSEQRAGTPAVDTRAEGLHTAEATVVSLPGAREAADGSEAAG